MLVLRVQKPFMPLGSLRQQLLFPTDCPKGWSTSPHSSTSTATAMHHTGHDPERQQQQEQQQASESSPLLSSSTAVKPSRSVQRSAGHTRTGSKQGVVYLQNKGFQTGCV